MNNTKSKLQKREIKIQKRKEKKQALIELEKRKKWVEYKKKRNNKIKEKQENNLQKMKITDIIQNLPENLDNPQLKKKLSEICVIIHGIPKNKEIFKENIMYYINSGIKNIVICSYSICTDEELYKHCYIINNDTFGEKEYNDPKLNKCHKCRLGIEGICPKIYDKLTDQFKTECIYSKYKFTYNKNEINDDWDKRGKFKTPTTFITVITIRRSIRAVIKYFPHCKYIFRSRADILFPYLNNILLYFHTIIISMKLSEDIFNYKLIVKQKGANENRQWRINDWWIFGSVTDLSRYYLFKHISMIPRQPEAIIAKSYIVSKLPNISSESAINRFFFQSYLINGGLYILDKDMMSIENKKCINSTEYLKKMLIKYLK